MGSSKNLYKILGVSRQATSKDIKLSYMRLAKEMHPDRVPNVENKKNAEEAFKELSDAYSTLSDPLKRKRYDLGNSYLGHRYNGRTMREGNEGDARYNAYAMQGESMEEQIQHIFLKRQARVKAQQQQFFRWLAIVASIVLLFQLGTAKVSSDNEAKALHEMDDAPYLPSYRKKPEERL